MQDKLKYINYGLNAQSEADILPIYYGDQLANGAAYTAYKLKRAAQFTGHILARTCQVTGQAINYSLHN